MDKWITGHLKILYQLQWLFGVELYDAAVESNGGNGPG
jgi:hypothetical protein